PLLSLDPQRITQVLGNLLGNAIRHTPDRGSIVCRVARDGDDTARHAARITFAIMDTGPGIPPEALPHLFERSYRMDRARSRLYGGTGLGLAIARQLVEAHGGRIWAASDGMLGHGTTVAFSL